MELNVHEVWYIHKYETSQRYGGPEEGGWWYDYRVPLTPDHYAYEPPRIYTEEEEAYEACRKLHAAEYARREDEGADYTSVLSYRHDFFCYDVTTDSKPDEPTGPGHYE